MIENSVYREILENMDEGVLTIDMSGTIVAFNRAAASILGIRADIPVGRNFADVFLADQSNDEFVQTILDAVYDSETMHNRTVPFLAPHGPIAVSMTTSFLWKETSPASSEYGDGKKGVIAVFRDVTEETRLREAEKTLTVELKTALGIVRNSEINLLNANIGMLEILGNAIAKRDSDTNLHNYRVTLYTIDLGEAIGISHPGMQDLIKGAFLHDIGKIAISDGILLKKDRLTPEEHDIMKTHVKHGVDIIQGYPWLYGAADVVLYHHEKYDGSGYLRGLRGNEIPMNARIFAVADVFDALTSVRPYKKAMPLDDAIRIILKGKGYHFDPVVIQEFEVMIRDSYEMTAGIGEPILTERLGHALEKYW